MKKNILMIITGCLLYACGTDSEKKPSDEEKHIQDSISKANQKRKTDSLKLLNPLLILPPDSEFTGDYVDKYPTGIVKFKGFYRFGKRHGQWIAFYDNGSPWSEQHYDKGLKNGPNIVYYENTKVRYSGFYKNDKRDSLWLFYDTLGSLVKTLVYKNDKEISVNAHKP